MKFKLNIRQRLVIMAMVRAQREEASLKIKELRLLRAILDKVDIPKDELRSFQVTLPAGLLGPTPITQDNLEAINEYDRTHDPLEVEFEKAETRELKDLLGKCRINVDDFDWWDPLMDQFGDFK